jgi:hypothetical protein
MRITRKEKLLQLLMLASASLLVELCLLEQLGEETVGRLFIGEALIALPVICRVYLHSSLVPLS